MRIAALSAGRRQEGAAPRLGPQEAMAVLYELRHRAEHRLLEACQEFQDLAFEMEWRLRDWQALHDQFRWCERDLARSLSVKARFNTGARRRRGVVPRSQAWTRHEQQLRRKLARLETQIVEAASGIARHNREGAVLEREIVMLQQRHERITRGLRQMQRPRRMSVQQSDVLAAAMARLIVELSAEPGVGDLATLMIAARTIDDRLRD